MGIKAWSSEEELDLRRIYLEQTKDIDAIAVYFNKGHRSIISKLVNMGIYEKPEVAKEENRTVKTMLRDIEMILCIEIEGFNLNKKANLLALVESLEDFQKRAEDWEERAQKLEDKLILEEENSC